MLQLKAVSKYYDQKAAVKNVSFDVGRGEIFGLLGPNGAGKTSTIRMICAITLPDEGEVFFLGQKMSDALQSKIGYLPEERGLYRKMKVGDTLLYFAQLKGMPAALAKEKIGKWLERFDLTEWRDRKVEELSKGMQQKVQFISVVLHEPDLIILDEPFSGLDPINSEMVMDVILEFKEAGKTILFSTHRIDQVEKICDSIVLLNKGENILGGKVREVKQAYGKNTLHLDFDGSDAFLDELSVAGKIEIVDRHPKSAELRLLNGASAKEIISMANERVEIVRYELAEPSLKEIFMMRVKKEDLPLAQ